MLSLDVLTSNVTLVTPIYNVTNVKLISARIPNYSNSYITLKITTGSEIFSQKVYDDTTDCHYFGRMILHSDGSWDSNTDTVEMQCAIKTIDTLQFEFSKPDGTIFVPSDDWILKFQLCGTLDKMYLTKDDSNDNEEEEVIKQTPIETVKTLIMKKDPVVLLAIAFLIIGLVFMLFKR